MTSREERRSEAFEELKAILTGGEYDIEFILVEGVRDVEALRFIGVTVPIDIVSHVGQLEHDVASRIAERTRSALVLTDYDATGISLAKRITELLVAEGVSVQVDLRRKIGQLMGVLGLKTVESLDDWIEKNN